MLEIINKKKCSGCASCYNVCAVGAIGMESDEEGFLYPSVNDDACIQCGVCVNVCPYNNRVKKDYDIQKTYAGYNKNIHDRLKSSSGGIFVLLAKYIIAQGGIVCGAAFDDNYKVYHTVASDISKINKLIGSKYSQSEMGSCYKEIKTYLDEGRKVLFVGTSCQVAGLNCFLRREYYNLFCVDFICLGVPSPKIWKDYLEIFFEGENIQRVNFKDKNNGWHNFSLSIKTDKRRFIKLGHEEMFFIGYFKQLYSRPSCSECIFKTGNRDSDITISDCWGYMYIAPELDDNKGLSSIICHSEKGLELFDKIKDNLIYKEADLEDVKEYNPNYCTSAIMGKKRSAFWREYNKSINKRKVFCKYCSPNKYYKFLKKLVKTIIKR